MAGAENPNRDFAVNLQFMVRIESPLGLQLTSPRTGKLLPSKVKKESDTEVHFLKMEGKLGQVDLTSFWNIKDIMKVVYVDPNTPVSDWTIVDIDNFLRGNPHVSGGSIDDND